MFNFLRKSRVVKFICSACLLCSLASFANVYGADPEKISEAYSQGNLGFTTNTISLADAAVNASTGTLESGTLKWLTSQTTYKYSDGGVNTEMDTNTAWSELSSDNSKVTAEILKDLGWKQAYSFNSGAATTRDAALDAAYTAMGGGLPAGVSVNPDSEPGKYVASYSSSSANGNTEGAALDALIDVLENNSENSAVQAILTALGVSAVAEWFAPGGTVSMTTSQAQLQAISDYANNQDALLAKVFPNPSSTNSDVYNPLENNDENSKIALFLKKGTAWVAASKEIDLSAKTPDRFDLSNEQFYKATDKTPISDPSTPVVELSPGKYEIYGIITEKGDKTVISGPLQSQP